MTNLSININVNVGVTDELAAILMRLVPKATATATEQPEPKEEPALPVAQEPVVAAPVDDLPFPVEPPTQVAATPVEEQLPAEPAPAETRGATQPGKVYHGKDLIMEIISETRKRIQGDDYETNTSAENKKLGKELTEKFKQIALELASSTGKHLEIIEKDKKGNDIVKPTRLPEIGMEIAFKRSCEELVVEDGRITYKLPF